ncbi:ATP-binding protein [Actinomadura welshii]
MGGKSSGELDMTFRAVRAVPGQVRGLVTSRLVAWGVAGVSDDVELIASELVTNAVEHAPGREEVRVRLVREPHVVLLEVWDSSDTRPVRKLPLSASGDEAAPDAAALDTGHDAFTRGRGLPIVEALSESWGVTPTAPRGKWVWARCATVEPTAAVAVCRVLSPGA